MLRRLLTGTFKLEIVETDLQKLTMALDSAADKMMMAIVVASLVVGSSLVMQVSSISLPEQIHVACDCGIHRGRALRVLCDLSRDLPEVPEGPINFFVFSFLYHDSKFISEMLNTKTNYQIYS